MKNSNSQQIFYDPRRKRWSVFKPVVFLVFLFFLTIFGISFASVFYFKPNLPSLLPKEAAVAGKNADAEDERKPFWSFFSDMFSDKSLGAAISGKIKKEGPKNIAFYVNWDDKSFESLSKNISSIDEVIPEWFHLSDRGELVMDNQLSQQEFLYRIKNKKDGLKIIPLINNFDPFLQKWNPDSLSLMLASPVLRASVISELLNYTRKNGLSGVTIDFETVPETAMPNLVLFMAEIEKAFHAQNLLVYQAIPINDPQFNAKILGQYSDFLILMAYDEFSDSDPMPGPIASQNWFSSSLKAKFANFPSEKYIVALGNYGYDWNIGTGKTEAKSIPEIYQIAKDRKAVISFDSQALNPHFLYQDKNKKEHAIWYLDGATLFNQLSAINQSGKVYGVAVWRLGAEDEAIWRILESKDNLKEALASLPEIPEIPYVNYSGEGEFFRVSEAASKGTREIYHDSTQNLIKNEKILKFPSPYVIRRWGGTSYKKVILTFDDGPDKKYTPEILDILKKYDISAAFFVTGMNANLHPEIISRIHLEGHEIGSHTYSHPNISKIGERQVKFELDSTQRVIESITGKKTVLLRPPYLEDTNPDTAEKIFPLILSDQLGYFTFGTNVDPHDWQKPGSSEIVQRVIEGVKSQKTGVIMLHDSGGDRSQTVAALPGIIEGLKSQKYEFITISESIGLEKNGLMLSPDRNSFDFSKINNFTLYSISDLGQVLKVTFYGGIILGILRFVLIVFLAIYQKIKYRGKDKKGWERLEQFGVSVVIPAYNEEKVIVKTINSVLNSKYFPLEIIIVDDGSEDGTYKITKDRFMANNRVKVYRKENSGKADALNFGINQAKYEIIVTLDADTVFLPDTILKLARNFQNPTVGAVAGNAKVGNRINILTRWQALEYITSQNLDRRAFEAMNVISVVPGSVGAWRKKAIVSSGGFSSDTLAEDADLTFAIIRKGYRVVYEEQAIAYTEAPDSTRNFLAQRFRWMYGTIQTAWKHRGVFFRPHYGALGYFSPLNIFLFQFFFTLISPVMDIMILISIFWALWQKYFHFENFSLFFYLQDFLLYYGIFLAVEMVSAIVPFIFEKKEKWTLLFWLPLQRFYYRQLLYIVAARSLLVAVKGRLVGWGKLERKATVAQSTV